ncbi:MAG TPA: histidinol-phosphate transaminase [Egibacteraceae bacterium]|nr:histidinol-phosphate transaminase [Egibacteraceae bacterium]
MSGDTPSRVPVRGDLADVVPYGAPQLDVPVRLNTNETPFAPPAEYLKRLAERVETLPLHRYPDRRAWALRTALGERFGLPPERVWAANGSNELLLQLFQAYGGPGRTLLLFRPGYSPYPLYAQIALTDSVQADLDGDYRLTTEIALAAVEAHDPELICVTSPNNPTGMPVGLDVVRALHDASRALVIVDEAYVEFSQNHGDGAGGVSATTVLDELPRVVVTRTFSKAWRLAGIRLGYLLAHDWVIEDLRKVRLPYHLDALTQAAGLAALDMADEVTAHIAVLGAERDRVHAELAAMPDVTVWPSAANFLLLRTTMDGGALFEALLARGVLVRDFSSRPRLEGCLRVSIGTPEENDRFLAALKESLA